jgi:cysteine desulfurase / selenocysteine lyase
MPSLVPRSDFPLTARKTYLNAAGMGLVPLPVQRCFLEFAQRIGTLGTEAYFPSYDELMVAPRRAAARLFGCAQHSVAIINSVSEVISQVAAWRRPGKGENVVMLDIDHPSTSLPWLRAAADTGAEMRFARFADEPESFNLDAIEALVDRNTAAISVSHAQWTTGYRLDLAALSAIARAHDALLVVDATHTACVVPIDAPALGVDVIATGSFKWACAYSGTGACYVRPGLDEELRPVMVGSRTQHLEARPEGGPVSNLSYPPGAQRLEYGSSAHVLRVAFANALDYLMEVGLDRIFNHAQALGTELAHGLQNMGGQVLTPLESAARAGIITVRFPGRDSSALVDRLSQLGVVVLPRMGAIRFSPHLYNDSADIQSALEKMQSVIA